MFKQTTGKSAFLLKKNQEKKKLQETQKQQSQVLALQKHLRAYLARQRLLAHAAQAHDPRPCILLQRPLTLYSHQQLTQFVSTLAREQLPTRLFYLARLLSDNLERTEMAQLCMEVLEREGAQLVGRLVGQKGFASLLGRLVAQGKGCGVLNLVAEIASQQQVLQKVGEKVLATAILRQFDPSFVEIEDVYGQKIAEPTLEIVLELLTSKNYNFGEVSLSALTSLILHYLNRISPLSEQELSQREPVIAYLLLQLAASGLLRYEQITAKLVEENKQMILLIEDEEMLEEMEQKLRQREEMESLTNEFLTLAKHATIHPLTLRLFRHPAYPQLKQALLRFVAQLTLVFEDRRLIFVRELISSDAALSALAPAGDPIFHEGLKMKLLGMDDLEFKAWELFPPAQWASIISRCLALADAKVQKLADSNLPVRLVPFKKRATDELELKTVVDLLTDLHKKALRTKRLSPELFVNHNLSELLGGFLFGKGARRIERLLRLLPFSFSFESRFAKFHESVKADKTLHDRSLFLMEQVPEQLIIAVRRGNEFLDAFQSCMHRDLRRKYKIVFFNEQGLEEEGVDGGGIIKEFINRVLKSSFSEQFGLFLETPLREAFPNPLSPYALEYEFAGRLVGKAVYEGINIEQKFAEPFLNLLIGRQNTFQDLQFIDPDIYRGLLSLKHSTEDISEMEQTFVIYDQLPNGQNRLVDLLCPSKSPAGKQVLVNNGNKLDFILSYADFKCNKQLEEKTRLFRKGFLKVIKPEWLTMFSNQELNLIISGAHPDFSVQELSESVVLNQYHEKDETVVALWQTLREFTPEEKALFLLFVTSCSRPPALGFGSMKPLICISKDNNPAHLPTANTCMNVLRLPNYKNKALLKSKLLYAINAKAGFEFA